MLGRCCGHDYYDARCEVAPYYADVRAGRALNSFFFCFFVHSARVESGVFKILGQSHIMMISHMIEKKVLILIG